MYTQDKMFEILKASRNLNQFGIESVTLEYNNVFIYSQEKGDYRFYVDYISGILQPYNYVLMGCCYDIEKEKEFTNILYIPKEARDFKICNMPATPSWEPTQICGAIEPVPVSGNLFKNPRVDIDSGTITTSTILISDIVGNLVNWGGLLNVSKNS